MKTVVLQVQKNYADPEGKLLNLQLEEDENQN